MDIATFDRFYEQHKNFIYCFSLRITRNREDAEDVSQQVFLDLYRYLPAISGDETWLKTYLARTVVRAAFALQIRRKRQPLQSLEEMLEDPRQAALQKRISVIDNIVSQIAVDRILNKLPEKQKTSFILKYVYGYEHQEIALIMNCAPGTSKFNCFKACAKVTAFLQSDHEPFKNRRLIKNTARTHLP